MKDFDHLLSVWQAQPKRVRLSVDEVLKQVKGGVGSLKGKLRNKLLLMSAVLAAILAVMLFVPLQNTLSYAGLSVWVISMAYFLVVHTGDYRTLATLDATASPASYISHLKLYKKRRAFTNGRFFYYYAVAISVGLMLYSAEFISQASLVYKIAFYAVWLGYLGYIIFFWKKKVFQKESQQVRELLEQLGNLQQQFKA